MRSDFQRVNARGIQGIQLLLNDLAELLYPTLCLGCDRRGSWFCAQCDERVKLRRDLNHCLLCNRLVRRPGALCARDRAATHLRGLQSYGTYREAPLRRAIHWVKYQGAWAAVPSLASLALPRLAPLLRTSWEAIVPIPLSPQRFRERGFNQAGLLAAALCGRGAPLQTELVRTRDTEHQTRLGRADRRANVHDAFHWSGKRLGGRILLVDDVVTTGATLGAAARTLRNAGAREVWAVTLAFDPLVR